MNNLTTICKVTSTEYSIQLDQINSNDKITGTVTYIANTSNNKVYKRTVSIEASNLVSLSHKLNRLKGEFVSDIEQKLNTIEERLSLLLFKNVENNTFTAQLKCLNTNTLYVSVTREIGHELQTIAEVVKATYVELATKYKK